MVKRFSDEPVPTEADLELDELLLFWEEYEACGRSKSVLIAWLQSSPNIAVHISDVIIEHLEEPRKEFLSDVRNPITAQVYSDIYEMYLHGTDDFGEFPHNERQLKAYSGKTWNQLGSKQKLFEVANHFNKKEGHIKKIVSHEKKRRGD